MSGIFISYRREDSAPYAGRLYDRLSARFGAETVFMDVDDIKPGANFVSSIEQKIAAYDVLIVVIGKHWLSSKDSAGALRLQDARDFVRLEIASSLRRKILIIPALVAGAGMPRAPELPDALAELAERQAVELSDKDFARDVELVIEAVEKVRGSKEKRPPAEEDAAKRGPRKTIGWAALLPLALLAALGIWQWPRPSPAQFEGLWEAQVRYSWGASYAEKFKFRTSGDQLFGSASFLKAERGLQEGKIAGKTISFVVRFQSVSGSDITEHRVQYTGTLSGKELHFIMLDDRGYPPVEFVARKSEEPA
jgi:hypothetical protein